ncbi:hypothetical protein F2Q69_00056045 [Brassica cretica]|uniref:Uncharacterized protein n=1 Tax=Brassica cretica TaxID=69181 RepID=A0A8S9N2U2_BRACR|nr:hypothetical protein F2Q69_00056045 [Brassica cretica]
MILIFHSFKDGSHLSLGYVLYLGLIYMLFISGSDFGRLPGSLLTESSSISSGVQACLCMLEDAIEILEYVVGTRGEKLGMANPEVEDESRG